MQLFQTVRSNVFGLSNQKSKVPFILYITLKISTFVPYFKRF
jgi:hypothetical protein